MGIQGLLPLLEKASRVTNVSEFGGCVAAVDVYCWIHRGCYSCADKLFLNEDTDQYIIYCINRAELLINHNIRPILVFDGQDLPAKRPTEVNRQMSRHSQRQKINALLDEGNENKAKELMKSCISVTQEMAKRVIDACRAKNIDYIVAPYEADAQIAYLMREGYVDLVITEDSDLLVYDCKQCFYKLDPNGNGRLIDMSKISSCFGSNFTFEKFRRMCILSGCDYLPSLPGIGLGLSKKFFTFTMNNDLNKVLFKIPNYLKKKIKVTQDYVNNFIKADNTFRYQLVFNPIDRKLVPINPYENGLNINELTYAGIYFDNELAFQLAIGNVDVNDLKIIDSYNIVNGNNIWFKKWFDVKKSHNNTGKFKIQTSCFKNIETKFNCRLSEINETKSYNQCKRLKSDHNIIPEKNGFTPEGNLVNEYSSISETNQTNSPIKLNANTLISQRNTRNIFKVDKGCTENNVIVQSKYFTSLKSIEPSHSNRVIEMKRKLIENGKQSKRSASQCSLNSSGNTTNSYIEDSSDYSFISESDTSERDIEVVDISQDNDYENEKMVIKSSSSVFKSFKKHDIRKYFN